MNPSTPTTPENTPENEDFSPDTLQYEEELSSGNSRLAMIASGIVGVVLVGYLLLPASITQASSTPELPTPTMELGEASITATRPTDETAPAEAAAAATASATATTAADAAKPAPKPSRTVAARNEAAAVAAAAEADEVALAPVVPTAPVVVAEPAELAPATLKMNGRVLDENGRPLAGATILLKGSKAATSTDASGNYSLEVPAGADNTLLYGYGGYEDQLLRSRNTKTQNVTLVPRENGKRRKR